MKILDKNLEVLAALALSDEPRVADRDDGAQVLSSCRTQVMS